MDEFSLPGISASWTDVVILARVHPGLAEIADLDTGLCPRCELCSHIISPPFCGGFLVPPPHLPIDHKELWTHQAWEMKRAEGYRKWMTR